MSTVDNSPVDSWSHRRREVAVDKFTGDFAPSENWSIQLVIVIWNAARPFCKEKPHRLP
jgi:hypothetical protein